MCKFSLLAVSNVFCPRYKRCVLALLCGVLLVMSGIPEKATAQTAHFSGAQTYVDGGGVNIFSIAVDGKGDVFFTMQNGNTQMGGGGSTLCAQFADSSSSWIINGFTLPTGLAVDSSGNLYILDSGTGKIDEIVATNGSIPETASPTVITVATGITSTGDLAIDNHEDIFFTSVATNAVEEIVAVNGVIPPSPTVKAIGSGFRLPVGIAVDANGNLFVGDTFNNAVKEVQAVNGSIPASPTILTLGSGFLEPEGVVLDKSGNLYVSDYGNNALKQIQAVNGVIPSSPSILNLGPYSETQAVTVDSNNLLYVGDTGNNSGGSVFRISLAGGTFAPTNVGSSSHGPISMAFTFTAAGTLGSASVLTQGATGLDFVDSGSGSCKANTAYSSGKTCTVNVQFMPRFAGTRIGAVVLKDSTGNVCATGYVQGTGVGPQVSFLPGTQSTVTAAGLNYPVGVAVDGTGNVYVSDLTEHVVLKETPSAGGYTQTTVLSGYYPEGLAVDGGGNLYIGNWFGYGVVKEAISGQGYAGSLIGADIASPEGVAVDADGNLYITNGSASIFKETATLNPYNYIESTIPISGSGAYQIAVDGVGNLYVTDPGDGQILKETLSGSGYIQSTIVSAVGNVNGISVDGSGNVYVVNNQVLRLTPASSGYTQSVIADYASNGLNQPWGVATDSAGNAFVTDSNNKRVLKLDLSDPPSLTFASTPEDSTSADSPQTITLENIGNANLIFSIPASGNNPSITTNFTLDENAPSACPVIGSSSGTVGVLAAGILCVFPISFAPTVTGNLNGSLLLTDDNLNAAGPAYATQSISLSGIATPATPTITWSAPGAITYGTALSSTQLDATASAPGTFSYSPGTGTVLSAGTQSLTVTFTPTDTTNYTTASATVQLTVNSATPVLTWPAPAVITYGTALSGTQLNATASVPGTFSYSPGAGMILGAGTQSLNVTFTPTDTTDYTTATATVQLTVNKSTPVLTWPAPAAITYGTALSGTQLDATASVPGTFSYSPAADALLSVGTQQLTVVFTPTDATNYATATTTVQMRVNNATPTITWPVPVPITYGTTLSATQLDATANVPGTFAYSPGAGTVLSVGSQMLSVVFTPTDMTDYTTANTSVLLTVNKATPVVSWPAPAAITYGTALSGAQLNATASVPGTFSYTPGPGTVLTAGAHTLNVTFTPTDTTDYTTANATVQVTVSKTTPAVSWSAPAAITYGAALSGAQLNATASVPGTFVYSPAAGTVLTAGVHTLNVTFTPTDSTDYTIATSSAQLTVNKATPVITWPTPAPIAYGTALSSAQLDATANVPGTFAYTPAAGTILAAGTNTLRVVFTPNDTADYATANASVSLVVNPAPSFTLTASPSSLSIKQGSKAGSTISVNAINGFTGSVSLSISGLPKGVTAAFSPNPATKTSTVTVTVSNSASLGNSLLTITGKSGSLVPTTTITLSVVHK